MMIKLTLLSVLAVLALSSADSPAPIRGRLVRILGPAQRHGRAGRFGTRTGREQDLNQQNVQTDEIVEIELIEPETRQATTSYGAATVPEYDSTNSAQSQVRAGRFFARTGREQDLNQQNVQPEARQPTSSYGAATVPDYTSASANSAPVEEAAPVAEEVQPEATGVLVDAREEVPIFQEAPSAGYAASNDFAPATETKSASNEYAAATETREEEVETENNYSAPAEQQEVRAELPFYPQAQQTRAQPTPVYTTASSNNNAQRQQRPVAAAPTPVAQRHQPAPVAQRAQPAPAPRQQYPAPAPVAQRAQPAPKPVKAQVHQAQPQAHQAQPQVHKAQPQAHHAQPQVHQAQPQVFHAQPQVHQAQPQVHQAQPQVHQAQPQAAILPAASTVTRTQSAQTVQREEPIGVRSFVNHAPGSAGFERNFDYSFEGENQIKQEATGELRTVEDSEVVVMKGSYEYIGDDGETYTVEWYADETGFHPTAKHLPQPVAIPFPEQAEAVEAQIRFAAEEEAARGSSAEASNEYAASVPAPVEELREAPLPSYPSYNY